MANKIFLMILCFVFSISISVVSAQRCLNTEFFRPNSTYDTNRLIILSSLASNVTSQNGFYNTSFGQEPNKVYALSMCIPTAKSEDCSDCVQTASEDVIQKCNNQTEAFHWSGKRTFCLVRYSNRSFFGSLDLDPHDIVYNVADIRSNLTEFDRIWEGLMLRMVTEASSGNTSSSKIKYYAADITTFTSFEDIYAFMQCSSDLSPEDCKTCLRNSVSDYQTCCRGKQGGLVSRPSCFFRWDLYPFYGAFHNITSQRPLPSPDDQSNTPKKDSESVSTGTTVKVVVPIVVFIGLLIGGGCIIYWRRKSDRGKESYKTIEIGEGDASSSLKFELNTVQAATNDFSAENKLGEGGFGPVYKGKLPNGQEIAVKRLSLHSGQGEDEFKNEVLLLSRVQHRNLVKLLGFCLKEDERLLVYEFVPNSSLDHLIFDSAKGLLSTWNTRYNIIGGIARGLLYLHEDSRLRIIHRDLKPSNILLDYEMNPKISDFGMARLFAADETQGETSRVMGTYGYMAPEYMAQGLFSVKSDVYSFGVMVLEIISGRKNNRVLPNGLTTYAWQSWREERALDIVDPTISNGSRSEIMKCINIGLLCVQENVTRRPTMNSVVVWLSSSSLTLPVPTTPAFVLQGESVSVTSSEKWKLSCDKDSVTKLEPR